MATKSFVFICIIASLLHVESHDEFNKQGTSESTAPQNGRQLQLTAVLGMDQEIDFQEELRSAMSSHWEILQNIRYHTLISKMKVAQLDKKVKTLAKKIEGYGRSTKPSSEAPCDKESALSEKEVERDEDNQNNANELASLLMSLRELSHFYESFNTTTSTFDLPLEIEGGYQGLLRLVDKLKALANTFQKKDSGKRQTRKLTKALDAPTPVTTKASTVTRVTQSSVISQETENHKTDLYTRNITIQRGQTASLRCHNQGTATVVWTKLNSYGSFDILAAGQYVYARDHRLGIIYDSDSRDWILNIRDVKSRDEGLYRCEVNSDPSVSRNFTLDVRKKLFPSIVTASSSNVTVPVGSTASLNCRVANLGSYSVSWRGTDHYGNSVLLTFQKHSYASDSRIGINNQRGSEDWMLTIQDVHQEDEGTYTCIVNTSPHLSQSIGLIVYETPLTTTPAPSPPPEVNITIVGGTTYRLNCTFDSSLEDQVLWMNEHTRQIFTAEGAPSDPSQRIFTTKASENTLDLTIQEAMPGDEGTYKCMTKISSEAVIIYHLIFDTMPVIMESNESKIMVEKGTMAKLHCRVANLGNHTVAWTRLNSNGSSEIITVGQFTFDYNPRLYMDYNPSADDWMLKIKDADFIDEGIYQCQISTRPVISYSVILQVIESDIVNNERTDVVYNVTVEAGSTATLSCHVSNLGDNTVSWVRSADLGILTGQLFTFSPDARFTAHTKDNKTWNLKIANVRQEDEGEYLCKVSSYPITTTKFWLKVQAGTKIKTTSTTTTSTTTTTTTPSTTTTTTTTTTTPTTTSTTTTPSTTTSTTSTTTTSTTTEPEYCFHPFVMIPGNLCVLKATLVKLSWKDASMYCQSLGSELAVDSTISLMSYLVQQHGVDGENWTMWPFWVGAKEEREQNGGRKWKWIDGTRVDAQLWATNQPRKYGKRKAPEGTCMTLDGYQGYHGTSLPCHHRRRFVCLKRH